MNKWTIKLDAFAIKNDCSKFFAHTDEILNCVRAEVRPGALQDGDAVPECHRRGSAARLRGRLHQHGRGEARFRWHAGQLWPQTDQHRKVRLAKTVGANLLCLCAFGSGMTLTREMSCFFCLQHRSPGETGALCQQICWAFPWEMVSRKGKAKDESHHLGEMGIKLHRNGLSTSRRCVSFFIIFFFFKKKGGLL